jgi:hypothetical protein
VAAAHVPSVSAPRPYRGHGVWFGS